MPSGIRRLPEDEQAPPAVVGPETAASEPAVLALQRSAGNAAVSRLLAREPAAGFSFSPIRPDAQPQPSLDPRAAAESVLADHRAAVDAISAWFDRTAAPHKESLSIPGSIAELVHEAAEVKLTLKDGSEVVVRDKIKPPEIEEHIRLRARTQGIRLQEHRDAGDLAGIRSEMSAILANLGAIPTQLTLGSDDAKVTASISGKVTGEAKLGKVKVEGEVSGEGAEGSVSVPGGGKITGKVSGEGGGGSVTVPGAKFGVDVTGKGIKAEVKAGDLITVNGSLTSRADGGVDWAAEISVGTIGKLIMPEDVAKVFKGAQDTFEKSAGELVRNRDDPAKVKEHGAALAGAVGDALGKAKKSAAQKPGWRVGAESKGDSAGGLSGSVTFTWVF
jgi:hypothetical protein